MAKINCPECNKICEYTVAATVAQCPLCDTEFNLPIVEGAFMDGEPKGESEEIVGLTLTYQINHEQIDILAPAKTFLGREWNGCW